ncbi:Caprin-1 [Heterocephalus glaber]|uniref:Caprin-1 n=1 Tax=Heterocephalus glaber TaxID=10181 RepID=G5BHF6_HETGA|nr:Caprin-1 [Heterocephalus glaber]
MKRILRVIDKKLRNLEKKKGKLDDDQERMNKGGRLNQDQLDAVSKYQEVTNNLEFAKELQRSFMALSQDIQKTIKKTGRREQLMREEAEQKRLKTVLELQYVLNKLGDDEVQTADPLVRRHRVQDLVAQMQGPYNFIQDSVLDFENQTLDPAIVSAQPMNPTQNVDIPQLVCPPVHSESRLAQPNQVSVQPEATQAPLVLSTTSGFPGWDEQPLHSSRINVNAAPFQSMQMVFNMNAPVPPVNEPETLKQQNQYQSSYNQSFPSQPHQVEQTELQQEQLQTVVGTYHGSQDQPHQVTGKHQQPPQQNTGFPRSSQPYYNSHGVFRGGSRGARGLMNGYRGPPANGFRGGYDGYCSSFSNTPNSGYTQSQFRAPRDYSGYQRDGYQQNFKQGSGQSGPRGAPRGNILWW